MHAKKAIAWSCFWIGAALLFNVGIFLASGTQPALRFLTGYLMEKALSLDNLFVFYLIFSHFSIPRQYLPKILFWGVLGALVFRAIFIISGIEILKAFHWIAYFFGAFLIAAGIKLARKKEQELHPEKSWLLRGFQALFPVTHEQHDDHFFVKKGGKYLATPLFLALITIETTDIFFALDSVPAILAITRDPFLVYTSNIFAVLGLRSLYFALDSMIPWFYYLHYALAGILVFIGVKMIASDILHVPISLTLGIITLTLAAAIVASLLYPKEI